MATYGYIRTSRDQEPDRPGMNPDTQRRDLTQAGVPERNIHADIDVSGSAGVATRNGWRSVDSRLKHGDVLVVAALDRIGRRSLDVMGKIYDLVNAGSGCVAWPTTRHGRRAWTLTLRAWSG